MRGAFILFEGVDRCGKTTQAKRLVDELSTTGKAVLMRFPDRETVIGRQINDYLANAQELDDHAVHLLFSANRWEKKQMILDLLRSGTHVVMDRYAMSGVAFSAAKPGMTHAWCAAPDEGLPAPDAVLYMALAPEVAAQRGGFGQERYEQAPFQTAVRAQFELVRAALGKCEGTTWTDVDADGSIEEVAARVAAAAQGCVEKAAGAPIRSLWAGATLQ